MSVLHSVIIKIYLEAILCRQTGIPKISFLVSPFLQAAIVVHLHIILDDEGYEPVPKTLFKKKQPPYTAISILEWMYFLESAVKINYVLKLFIFTFVIFL